MSASGGPEIEDDRPDPGGRAASGKAPGPRFRKRFVLPFGLFLAALAVRALPWPFVLTAPDGAHPFGNDAYYHLRRIWYGVERFPDFLHLDLYLNHPYGGQAIWTPLLDRLAAVLVRVVVGPGDQAAMERFVVWLPPVLGALTVAAAYGCARRHLGGRTALVAGCILCLLPAHFWYSQIGFVDHHVLVALATTLLLWSSMNLLRDVAGNGHRSTLRPALLQGLALAGAVWVWPGCILHVAVAELGMLLRFVTTPGPHSPLGPGRPFALANAVACAALLPFCLDPDWDVWGNASPVVLSYFQPLFFAAAALGFAALGELWRRLGHPTGAGERGLHAGVVGGLVLGGLLVCVPELQQGLLESVRWFAKGEHFQAGVGESSALFAFGRERPEELFSRALYAAPLLLLGWARSHRRRPEVVFLCGWCAALLLATLVQRRFMNSASIAWSLVLAHALCVGWDELKQRLPGRPIATIAVGLAVLALVFQPVAASYRGYFEAGLRDLRGEAPEFPFRVRVSRLRDGTARWLREHTPATAGYLDAGARPEYGVLAPWPFGHVLKYVGERPSLQDNFGDDVAPENFALAREFYAAEHEAEALEMLADTGVRYVITRGPERPDREPLNPGSMQARLAFRRGTHPASATRPHAESLQRLRLVYESEPFSGAPGRAPGFYKIYEIVEGAQLAGRARPGSVVSATLEVRPQDARGFVYRARAVADAEGRYALRLPYPNESFSPAVEVGAVYVLESERQSSYIRVSEADVRNGERVVGPDL